MATQADDIREYILEHFIEPAREEGRNLIEIRADDVRDAMVDEGLIPRKNIRNVCQALSGDMMLEMAGAETSRIVESPPSGYGSNFFVRFTFKANPEEKKKAAELVDQGKKLYDAKDFLGVITSMDEAIGLDPEFGVAWNNRGVAKDNLKQYEESIKDVEEALELEPESSVFRNSLASIRAEIRAQQAVEKRLGSLADTEKEIRKIIDELIEEYKNLIKIRDKAVKFLGWLLIFLAVILFFGHSILNIICVFGFCEMILDHQNQTLPLFTYEDFIRLSVIIASVSVPFWVYIRLKSRDAEEVKVLAHDYRRMLIAENRIMTLFSTEPEQRLKYQQKLIDQWMYRSPIETLLKLKSG